MISIIDKDFQENGFKKCPYKHALYLKMNENGDKLMVCLYVNELIFTGNSLQMFEESKRMTREFEMTDIGFIPYYLGIKVKQMEERIFIS